MGPKTLSLIMLYVLAYTCVSAQGRLFRLKDGTDIRGHIYRRTDSSLLVRSTDGNIYNLDKSKLLGSSLLFNTTEKGWVHSIQTGLYAEKDRFYPLTISGVETDYLHGYRFKKSNIVSVLAGTSIAYDWLLRYGLVYQRILMPGQPVSFSAGAGIIGLKDVQYTPNGGWQLHTEFGCIMHKYHRTAYTIRASYDINSLSYLNQYEERIKYSYKSLTLKFGLMF